MRYRILGPIEVWQGERQVAIGGPQQKALLAILLLNANQVVSADRLVEYLWGERPPPTARGLLQGCVAQLRRVLSPARPLLTRPPGYVLRVEPGELDLHRFEELAADPAHLVEALALWRGTALDGIGIDACEAEAARLEDRRLAVLEERFEVDLQRGARSGLVGELQAQVRCHPLRERLWALLMAALYADDRQADALAAYREVRRTLMEQLGVEPGPLLRELHGQILAGAELTGIAVPRSPVLRLPPAQLPAAPVEFVGRASALERLDELLGDAGRGAALGVISGTAGVGKTALAVHWAHRVREKFEDGQLYVNLRGYAQAPPMRPVEALAGFLRAFGVAADQVPIDQDQAAALYRSLLAGKRVLIVLDNAHDVEQVRPLLPGGPGCLVLVTGRGRLAGLVARDGGRLRTLDVLEPSEATELLARLLGRERVEAEPRATADLVTLCARLPLALRITAANLVGNPRRTIAGQVAELTGGGRLDALAVTGDDQSAVRGAFDQSYAALEPHVARMFRLLGLVPGPEITAVAAAALMDVPVATARALLERLAGAHLLDRPVADRYVFHDLLRLYARERVADEADREAATDRLHAWYVDLAYDAARLLYPQVLRLSRPRGSRQHADPAAALAWLEAERPNLVAAATSGPPASAWLLADALRGYFWLRRHTVDWLAVAEAGLAAAEEPRSQAMAEFSLGMANLCLNRYRQAIDHQRRALTLCERAHWDEGTANALGNLGNVHFELGELELAAGHHSRALDINRQIGSMRGEAVNLDNLGHVCLTAGRLSEAGQHLRQALNLHRRLDDRHSEAFSSNQLGVLHWRLGQFDQALVALLQALSLYQAVGNLNGQAMVLGAIAAVHNDAGRPADGLSQARRALDLVQQTGDRYTEAFVRNRLGSIHHRLGDPSRAIDDHGRALLLAQQTGARYPQIEALTGLALAHLSRDAPDRATTLAHQSLAAADKIGYQLLAGHALVVLADIHRGRSEAAEFAHRALAVARATGDHLIAVQATALLDKQDNSVLDRPVTDDAVGRLMTAIRRSSNHRPTAALVAGAAPGP